jgi:hypothetical protein
LEAVDALGKIKNPTEQDAVAMAIFGRSAQDLFPLIKAGSKQLQAFIKQAHLVGAVVSESDVAAFAKFDDSMDVLKSSFSGISKTLVATFTPALQAGTDAIQKLISSPEFQHWLRVITFFLSQFVDTLVHGGGLKAAFGYLSSLGDMIIKAFPALDPATLLQRVLGLGVTWSAKFKDWVDSIPWAELSQQIAAAISGQPWAFSGSAFGQMAGNLWGAISDAISGHPVTSFNMETRTMQTSLAGGIDWGTLGTAIGQDAAPKFFRALWTSILANPSLSAGIPLSMPQFVFGPNGDVMWQSMINFFADPKKWDMVRAGIKNTIDSMATQWLLLGIDLEGSIETGIWQALDLFATKWLARVVALVKTTIAYLQSITIPSLSGGTGGVGSGVGSVGGGVGSSTIPTIPTQTLQPVIVPPNTLPGGVSPIVVNLNANVSNGLDVETMAYQIANVIARRSA